MKDNIKEDFLLGSYISRINTLEDLLQFLKTKIEDELKTTREAAIKRLRQLENEGDK